MPVSVGPAYIAALNDKTDRVVALANEAMKLLAGIDDDEAHTALTLVVTAMILATAPPGKEHAAADAMKRTVLEMLDRPDIVEWIKQGIKHLPPTSRRKQ